MPASTRTPAFFVGWQSRPISRILCTRHVRKRGARSSHSSRRAITDALKLPTRRRDGGPVLHLEDASLPTWNCSGWRLPCRSALQQPRCALTAPFHPYLIPACAGPSAVCFLLPCSACRHGWPLAITLPYGVRTFLALFGRNRRGRDCLACFAGAHFNTAANLRGFDRWNSPIAPLSRSSRGDALTQKVSARGNRSNRASTLSSEACF
ncbi:hypothetical protein R69888_04106 [Paraburkholderia haematera]|uniref:Uncharacterized protein n=1 Tax=Paraburkholderia haematera TaxID=2793077 RepID=A0ABM8RXB5_9BURK|nr:hypothetical protein R69888_04106 [Paraburkholderia haematera]